MRLLIVEDNQELAELLAKEVDSNLSTQPESVLIPSDGADICAVFGEVIELRASNRQVRIDK